MKSAYEVLTHPLLSKQPENADEWQEYNRVMLEGVLQNVSDNGRISDSRALSQSVLGSRPAVQLAGALTATESAGVPTISVAAHTVAYDFGDVAYNAGDIIVADLEMVYYVFADDGEFEGGAVTYYAFDDVSDGVTRDYRYVGAIETPALGDPPTDGGFGGPGGTGTTPGTGTSWA